MKFGNLFSITTSAALLLQIGTFVDANPMFAQPPAQHNDDASTQDACSGTIYRPCTLRRRYIKLYMSLYRYAYHFSRQLSRTRYFKDVLIEYGCTNAKGLDDIVFENNTKHVISWHMTENAFEKVNITLVNKDDDENVVYLGEFGK